MRSRVLFMVGLVAVFATLANAQNVEKDFGPLTSGVKDLLSNLEAQALPKPPAAQQKAPQEAASAPSMAHSATQDRVDQAQQQQEAQPSVMAAADLSSAPPTFVSNNPQAQPQDPDADPDPLGVMRFTTRMEMNEAADEARTDVELKRMKELHKLHEEDANALLAKYGIGPLHAKAKAKSKAKAKQRVKAHAKRLVETNEAQDDPFRFAELDLDAQERLDARMGAKTHRGTASLTEGTSRTALVRVLTHLQAKARRAKGERKKAMEGQIGELNKELEAEEADLASAEPAASEQEAEDKKEKEVEGGEAVQNSESASTEDAEAISALITKLEEEHVKKDFTGMKQTEQELEQATQAAAANAQPANGEAAQGGSQCPCHDAVAQKCGDAHQECAGSCAQAQQSTAGCGNTCKAAHSQCVSTEAASCGCAGFTEHAILRAHIKGPILDLGDPNLIVAAEVPKVK